MRSMPSYGFSKLRRIPGTIRTAPGNSPAAHGLTLLMCTRTPCRYAWAPNLPSRPVNTISQPQHPLGDVAEHQLRADRGDAGDLDLAEIAFDVVFAGVAHAAMRHDCGLARAEAGLRGAVFGSVRIGAGLLAAVIGGGRAPHHQFRCFEL